MRTGASIAVFGIAAMVLPLFGLQFRKLGQLGEKAPVAGFFLMLIGVAPPVIIAFKHRRGLVLKTGGGVLGTLVVLFILLKVVTGFRNKDRLAPLERPNPAPQPGWPAAPLARGADGPKDPKARAETGFPMLRQQFGAERIVRLHITGIRGMDFTKLVDKVKQLADPGQQPGCYRRRPRAIAQVTARRRFSSRSAVVFCRGRIGMIAPIKFALPQGSVRGDAAEAKQARRDAAQPMRWFGSPQSYAT